MKRLFSLLLVVFLLYSCSTESELHGTWYVDEDGQRNVIQFSENDSGAEVFVWAIYDIENDETLSMNKGYFEISGDSLDLTYSNGVTTVSLNYEIDGDKLTLKSDTYSMVLTKYVLDE